MNGRSDGARELEHRHGLRDELDEIAAANGGLIRPQDVVSYARSRRRSLLYGRLIWDDRKAAAEHRLWQAREILAEFRIVSRVEQQPIRMFLSLVSDRHEDGGYRPSDDVLSNLERRAELRLMAIRELGLWVERYGALTELRTVFAAVKRVVKQYKA